MGEGLAQLVEAWDNDLSRAFLLPPRSPSVMYLSAQDIAERLSTQTPERRNSISTRKIHNCVFYFPPGVIGVDRSSATLLMKKGRSTRVAHGLAHQLGRHWIWTLRGDVKDQDLWVYEERIPRSLEEGFCYFVRELLSQAEASPVTNFADIKRESLDARDYLTFVNKPRTPGRRVESHDSSYELRDAGLGLLFARTVAKRYGERTLLALTADPIVSNPNNGSRNFLSRLWNPRLPVIYAVEPKDLERPDAYVLPDGKGSFRVV